MNGSTGGGQPRPKPADKRKYVDDILYEPTRVDDVEVIDVSYDAKENGFNVPAPLNLMTTSRREERLSSADSAVNNGGGFESNNPDIRQSSPAQLSHNEAFNQVNARLYHSCSHVFLLRKIGKICSVF